MEIVIQPKVIHIMIEYLNMLRRIYTDGRDFPEGFEPSYMGYSIGKWIDEDGDGRYDALEVETRLLKGPRTIDPSGALLHKDNQTVVKERFYLDKANPDILHEDVTTIDHALTRPWKPRHTYLHGASYGGLVGSKLVETLAKNADGTLAFDGAMFNSGAVGGATLNYQHRVDLRAVYQYVCKNLPRPEEAQYPLWMGVAPDAKMTLKDLDVVVDECTGVAKPAAQRSEQQKKNLADIIGVMGYPENLLVRHMQAATLLFRDIVQRTTGGRDPFDNTGVRYRGSSNDEELNRNVARFTADPAAVAALKADGDTNGKLPIPVVSIHSINDPQVPVEQQAAYRDTVAAAGSTDRLVQAYTDERAHTGQSPPELAATLDALVQWVEKGTKPTAQSIAAACEQFRATIEGPCRWHPEFTPKPYGTKFYPREAAVR
jgi:hypothetical protein